MHGRMYAKQIIAKIWMCKKMTTMKLVKKHWSRCGNQFHQRWSRNIFWWWNLYWWYDDDYCKEDRIIGFI